jgi:hypothetical protein
MKDAFGQNISNRLTTDLVLLLNCDEDRSQLKIKNLLLLSDFTNYQNS